MNVVHTLNDIAFDKHSVVTVGTFDGVHQGHQEIIREAVRRAKAREGRSVVVTFEPHPREVLGSRSIQLLTTIEERRQYLSELNPDVLLVVPFTYEFSRQSFREFYLRYIVNGIGVSEIVEGYDHHFGRDREGSIEVLVTLGKEFGFSVVAVKPFTVGGEAVSSSRVREYLEEGQVESAAQLTGRSYALRGSVVRGDGRGKQLGYPTANVVPSSPKKLVPKNGVYFVGVRVDDRLRAGMANIGSRPTFTSNGARSIEANILDYDGDLYGKSIEVHFVKRLRDEQKFTNPQELIDQMRRDQQQSVKLQEEFVTLFR